MFASIAPPDLVWLLAVAFGVGTLIGAVGIGGVLLIPALTAFAALPIHTAMATALFTFIFTDPRYRDVPAARRIDWILTRPVLFSALILRSWARGSIRSRARPRRAAARRCHHLRRGLHAFTWHGLRRPRQDDPRAQRFAGCRAGLPGSARPLRRRRAGAVRAAHGAVRISGARVHRRERAESSRPHRERSATCDSGPSISGSRPS